MSLSAFIRGHHDAIVSQFAVFAKTLMPPGAEMTEAQLRDHAAEILTAVVQDIGIPQTLDEQSLKSRGNGSAKTMAASCGSSYPARVYIPLSACRVSGAPRNSAGTL